MIVMTKDIWLKTAADISGDDSSQVVRSVILTRPGLEESARAGVPVQDMVRGVPADLFRTCLARVRIHRFLSPIFPFFVSCRHGYKSGPEDHVLPTLNALG